MNSEQSIGNFHKIWFISLIASTLLVILVYTINYFYEDDFSIFDSISLLLYTIIPGILVTVSIWALRYEKINGVPKKSLIFLCLAFVCWFLAEQVWMLYDYVFMIDPFPSAADIFYISAPLLMLISLVIFLRPLKNQISKKSIIIAICISFLLLIPTVIITYQENNDVNFIELIIVLFYPIVDAIVLIPIIITVSLLSHSKKNLFWVMITLGMMVLIAADTSYLFLELTDNYYDNHPVDLLWLVSYLIWTFSLWYGIYNSKISSNSDDDLKKYETQLLGRYGAIAFLVIMNVTVVTVLLSINYFAINQYDLEFLDFFTSFLVMIMVIFSILIILLNKTMQKNLKQQTSHIENISNELIKAEKFSAIGELASRLAHDMRNPLGVITSSNMLIKKNPTKEIISKNNERIQRSLDRMEHQINNVMDFVRIRKLHLQKISLHKLIDDTLNSLIIPNGITIKKPIENPSIQCDVEQFLILFYNVVYNAIQKLEKNGGDIIINYEQNDVNNIIKIQDSGEAIPDETISKIFEPLFTTKYQGTGLGLASCKQIVKQHKGTIRVKNNPTTFIITIPKDLKE